MNWSPQDNFPFNYPILRVNSNTQLLILGKYLQGIQPEIRIRLTDFVVKVQSLLV